MRALHVFMAGGLAAASATAALVVWPLGPFIDHGTLGAVAAASAQQPPSGRAARLPPLLGADGTPQPALPHAVPRDPRERTMAALYATRLQALALEAELDGAVVWVEADCCDTQALSVALELADGQRSGRHLGLDAPVFVTGANLQRAALVADRLTDDGYLQVFLVTR